MKKYEYLKVREWHHIYNGGSSRDTPENLLDRSSTKTHFRFSLCADIYPQRNLVSSPKPMPKICPVYFGNVLYLFLRLTHFLNVLIFMMYCFLITVQS